MMPQAEHERLSKEAERRESIGDLLKELAYQSAGLVRDEVALARQEISEKLKSFKSAVLLIAIGALLGLIAFLAATAAAIIALSEYVTLLQSALIVAGALALIASVICITGIRMLDKTNMKPEQTLETMEENKEWLKDLT